MPELLPKRRLLSTSTQKLDLLFTDVELGSHKEGGIGLGKLMAETRAGTPVLYTSGRELTDGLQTLFGEPSAFLPKPYTAKDLTNAVSELLSPRNERK